MDGADTNAIWISQLRAALLLSAMPVFLAVFAVLTGQFGKPDGGAYLALFIAWLSFVAVVYAAALLLVRMLGPDYQLRTRIACPQCGGGSPIICYRCTHCSHELGLPATSRHTYLLAMTGYGVFLLVLYLRPDRWLH